MAFGNEGKIFIGSDDGLFYSSNSTDWTQAKNSGLDSVTITGLCVDAAGRIYAAGYFQQPPYVSWPPRACLYRSEDNGISWQKFSFADTLSTTFNSEVFATGDNKIIFATSWGTFVSEDSGESWNTAGPPHEECREIILRNDNLYAVSSLRQLLRSTDNGGSWDILCQTSNTGLTCVEASNSGRIYLGAADGLLYSSDDGNTWVQTLNVNTTVPALCIAFDWNGNPIIGTESGVYRSTDGGDSWQASGLQGISVVGLSKSPKGYMFSATIDSGLYRSGDTAKSWTRLDATPLPSIPASSGIIAIDSTGNVFYALANAILKSTDNGSNWDSIFNFPIPYVRILSVSKSQNIYAVLDSLGLLRSTDGGMNWNDAGDGLPGKVVNAFVIGGDYLFAGYWGVYRTAEDKINWQLVGLRDLPVEKMSVDSRGNIYAATYASGTNSSVIYLSTDYGDSWSIIDGISPYDELISMEVDNDHYMFALTQKGTLLKSVRALTSVFNGDNPIPDSYVLFQNYPNPFNPSTEIRYGVAFASRVTLKIYDVLGREVAVLANNEFKNAGWHTVTWNGRDRSGNIAASGIYLCRLVSGSNVRTLKLALTK